MLSRLVNNLFLLALATLFGVFILSMIAAMVYLVAFIMGAP